MIGPQRFQVCPIAPGKCHRPHEGIRVEASGQDDDIEVVQFAIGSPDAPGLYTLDGIGNQARIRVLYGPVVVGREYQALAQRAVVGPELLPQQRILYALLQVLQAGLGNTQTKLANE